MKPHPSSTRKQQSIKPRGRPRFIQKTGQQLCEEFSKLRTPKAKKAFYSRLTQTERTMLTEALGRKKTKEVHVEKMVVFPAASEEFLETPLLYSQPSQEYVLKQVPGENVFSSAESGESMTVSSQPSHESLPETEGPTLMESETEPIASTSLQPPTEEAPYQTSTQASELRKEAVSQQSPLSLAEALYYINTEFRQQPTQQTVQHLEKFLATPPIAWFYPYLGFILQHRYQGYILVEQHPNLGNNAFLDYFWPYEVDEARLLIQNNHDSTFKLVGFE